MTKTNMMRRLFVILLLLALCLSLPHDAQAADAPDKLLVVWTSGDREVALNMVFMYSFYAQKNGWWDKVRLLVWGPSAKLLAEDQELQDYVKKMRAEGVDVIACELCAEAYGVKEKLQALRIPVFHVGTEFTTMLKSDWKTITF